MGFNLRCKSLAHISLTFRQVFGKALLFYEWGLTTAYLENLLIIHANFEHKTVHVTFVSFIKTPN